ncbi:hypothetical protein HanRHA438_Chr09g0389641 [Helianthus annuus]|nr:hypothetical protein HanRHA438_Chr09g0389641 [Helianthus annuus]
MGRERCTVEHHRHWIRKRCDNRISRNVSNMRSINMNIDNMIIHQQWSINRMIINRYIINQRSNSRCIGMIRVMLKCGVRSNNWLKGHSRLRINKLHVKVSWISKHRIDRGYGILHGLI